MLAQKTDIVLPTQSMNSDSIICREFVLKKKKNVLMFHNVQTSFPPKRKLLKPFEFSQRLIKQSTRIIFVEQYIKIIEKTLTIRKIDL